MCRTENTYLQDPTFLEYLNTFRPHRKRYSNFQADCLWSIFRSQSDRVYVDESMHRMLSHPENKNIFLLLTMLHLIVKSCRYMLTLKLRWKFCTLTFLYGAVLRWHHNKRPSLAVISSTEMSWMANRKMIVQIMPNVIFKLPSTISSAPIDTNLTPFDAIKSKALLTLAIYQGKFEIFD